MSDHKILKLICLSVLTATMLTSCEPVFDEPVPVPGDADFTRYVAVGNSLTAGYADNALYRDAQLTSFPNLLATQFQEAGGGPFSQPLVEPGVGSNAQGDARLILRQAPDGSFLPAPAAEEGQDIFSENIADQGPFNNLGVPGAKSYHLLMDDYADHNPFYGRFAADSETSVLQQAMELDPTFFTLWVGGNDILGWAMSGGTGDAEGGMETNDITPTDVFENSIETLLSQLTANGAKGLVLNVPEVTRVPVFNIIPWNGLELTDDQVQALIDGYDEALPGYLPDRESYIPDFQEGANGFVIEDPEREVFLDVDDLKYRMATEEDKILFTVPLDSLQPPPAGPGWGTAAPIPDEYTLRGPQAEIARQATEEFNSILNSVADEQNLPVLDVPDLLERTEAGILFDGAVLTSEFVSGGLYSLDGIHLADRGNAQLANEIIEIINREFGASVSPVNVGDFQGVQFP